MSRLPWMKFFPRDYVAATRPLSISARGFWVDALCLLWDAPTRGRLTLGIDAWARVAGVVPAEAEGFISELETAQIAEVARDGNGGVTLASGRMLRDEGEREGTRQRVQRHREAARSAESDGRQAADELPGNRYGSADVTRRSQKAEGRGQTTEAAATAAAAVTAGGGVTPPLQLEGEGQLLCADSAAEVLAGWNSLPEPFPRAIAVNAQRRKALNARLREPFFRARWREALMRMQGDRFYSGGGSRRWVATLDFFLRSGSVERLCELPEPAPVDAAAAERLRAF